MWDRSATGCFDAMIVWGDEEAVIGGSNEHLSAGADHVCVQVLNANLKAYPREQWRRIASALKSVIGPGQHLANQVQMGMGMQECESADGFALPLRRWDEGDLVLRAVVAPTRRSPRASSQACGTTPPRGRARGSVPAVVRP